MSAPRLFCPGPITPEVRMTLPESAAHHAVRVLRLREGDALTVFNGEGGEFPANLVAIGKRDVTVELGVRRELERESRLHITLVQALQSGDRMDVTVQKAVELGVTTIAPVESRRCVVRLDPARAAKRAEHWRQIVVAACEQCGRNRLPEVRSVEPFLESLARPAGDALRILMAPQAEASLADFQLPLAVELLVGPEGGLTADEVEAARTAGFIPVRLGPRVLRTETAGMAAVAAMQARWGDFV